MTVKTMYVKPEDPAPPVLSVGRLSPGELYKVVTPSSAEGAVVLATKQTPALPQAVIVLHSMNPAQYAVGTAILNTDWRCRRLGAGEYIKLVQGEADQ
ncbi:hypothetical protein HOV25_gp41 [Pseudomonas phage RLP]|uniref:Uncharacterized protein n=1 Tax=Pseudomonas phage RLP TaxID=2483418 RepID=A0A455NTI4_9CAUD|nr:hypothetical protein HOV25_gp41 [Pseudomonas phage RLP]AZS49174.1 hypothetical protein RLP_0041 [Pseudomonas phage RLP]